MSSRTKRLFWFTAIVAIATLSFAPHAANAGAAKAVLDCVTDPGTCLMNMLLSFINSVGRFFITVAATLLGMALDLSATVLNSTAVKVGFGVSLAVANLGFVIGIIVIAIATILRLQSYGMKQLLLKLIAVAILVNFGLIIAGSILNFADQLTKSFLTSAGVSGSEQFKNALTGSLQPEKQLTPPDPNLLLAAAADQTMQDMLAVLFAIVFNFLLAFVLLAIAVMFLIRYLYLTILFILLPLAWLLGVFPAFSSQAKKWWDKFLHWTFFAPVAVFFIYLVVATKQQQAVLNSAIKTPPPASSGAMVGATIGQPPGFIQYTGQQVVLCGLTLGALFAANAFGIGFASTAMGLAQKAGKGVGGWAASRGKRVATAPLRGRLGAATSSAFQRVGANWAGAGGRVGRFLTAPIRYAGRGIEATAATGGKAEIDAAKKRLSGFTQDQLARRMSTFTAPQRQIALESLMKDKNLDKIGSTEDIKGYLRPAEFARYGQSKLLADLRKATGSDGETMDKAADAIEKGGSDARITDTDGTLGKVGADVGAMELLNEASKRFAQTFNRDDVRSKLDVNNIFKENPSDRQRLMQRAIARGFMMGAPALASAILPGAKPKQLNQIRTVFNETIDQERRTISIEPDLEQRKKRTAAWEDFDKLFKHSLANNSLGILAGTETAQATPATAAAPTPPPARAAGTT